MPNCSKSSVSVKPARYELVFQPKWLFEGCSSLASIAETMDVWASDLRAMEESGVVQIKGTVEGGEVLLETDDAKVARKYRFSKRDKEQLWARDLFGHR